MQKRQVLPGVSDDHRPVPIAMMTLTGLELSQNTTEKQHVHPDGGAQSGALAAPNDTDSLELARLWERLTDADKANLLAVARRMV